MKPLLSKAIRPFIWALSAGLCITASAQTPVAAEPLVDVESPQAAPAKPSGMRELVLLVLQNHPELSQAEAESRVALSRVSEARSTGYPQLSFSSSYGQEQQKLYLSKRTNEFKDQAQAQFKLTQPLFDMSLGANLRRIKAGSLGMDWQLVIVREQLVLKTVELYIEVIRQHQLTELARQNLKLHRNYVSQMKDIALADLGRASDLSVSQARVALAESTFIHALRATAIRLRAESQGKQQLSANDFNTIPQDLIRNEIETFQARKKALEGNLSSQLQNLKISQEELSITEPLAASHQRCCLARDQHLPSGQVCYRRYFCQTQRHTGRSIQFVREC